MFTSHRFSAWRLGSSLWLVGGCAETHDGRATDAAATDAERVPAQVADASAPAIPAQADAPPPVTRPAAVAGGGGASGPGAQPSGPIVNRVDACASQSESRCAAVRGCAPYEAYAVEPERGCYTGPRLALCANSTRCSAQFGATYARDQSGTLWRVISNCVPGGMTPLDPQPMYPADSGPCPEPDVDGRCRVHADEAACSAARDAGCAPMFASLVSSLSVCVHPSSYLGCRANRSCNAAAGLFRDVLGKVWLSGTSSLECLPAGFASLDYASFVPDAGGDLAPCP